VLVLQTVAFRDAQTQFGPYPYYNQEYAESLSGGSHSMDLNLAFFPSIPSFPPLFNPSPEMDFITVNGRYEPFLDMQPGEMRRLRLINAGHASFLSLDVDGCSLWTIAKDGVYYNSPRASPSGVMLIPGSRADVVVQCPNAGSFELRAKPKNEFDSSQRRFWGEDTDVYGGVLMTFDVDGPQKNMNLPSTLPGALSSPRLLKDLRRERVDNEWSVNFRLTPRSETREGESYPIPTMGFPGEEEMYTGQVARYTRMGSIEEWTISNYEDLFVAGRGAHPFHIHVNHFQIVDISPATARGLDYDIGDWRDTINPPTGSGSVTIRFPNNDYTGKHVMHCHVNSHSDLGMMAVLDITPPDVCATKGVGSFDFGTFGEQVGFPFDSSYEAGRLVCGVDMWCGRTVNVFAIRLNFCDGTASPKFGGDDGFLSSFSTSESDPIVEVRGYESNIKIEQMVFVTASGRASTSCGGRLGRPFSLSLDEGLMGVYGRAGNIPAAVGLDLVGFLHKCAPIRT